MALFRCGSDKTPTISDLSFTGKSLATNATGDGNPLTSYNKTFRCDTHDCIMGGIISSSTSSASAIVYFNGTGVWFPANNQSSRLGYTSSSQTTPVSYGMFVPKGTTVTTRDNSNTTYTVYFYKIEN